jgi:RNA polymerase sigma-70 factor (ECF subfamily)
MILSGQSSKPDLRRELTRREIPYHELGCVMPSPTTTFDLLEQARNGDQQALSRAFEKHRRRLAVLVHFKLGLHAREFAETEDVVQETCLRAFRDIGGFSYQSPGSFFHWLSVIADHVIVDYVRYQSRECRAGEKVRFRSETNPLGPEPVDARTPSRLFAQREAIERLLDRLNALPEDYRQAILMAKIERLSTPEMAARLGKSREAVALLVYRAVKRFRELTEASEA